MRTGRDYSRMTCTSLCRPSLMMEDALPVAFCSLEGSTAKSTAALMSSVISIYFFGAGVPETLADVDTIGLCRVRSSSRQNSFLGILMAMLPSSAVTLEARLIPSG